MSIKIAFIGLGVMGYPMSGYLVSPERQVQVYNRTQSRAQDWVDQYGGSCYDTPAAAATDASIVMACVGNDDDLRQITCGETGAFATMAPGSIFVDHTTVSAKVTHELYAQAKARGIQFLDAPVSGGESGAQQGQLSVMVGGDAEAYRVAEPHMQCYAKRVRHMGASGAGQLTKMVNQTCIAGLVQALAEALQLARASGLDGEAVIDVISGGAAQSWQLDNRASNMLKGEFEYGFAVDLMRKDLAIVLEQASLCDLDLPVTKLVDQFYAEVQAMGGNRWDTSSLMARMDALADKS